MAAPSDRVPWRFLRLTTRLKRRRLLDRQVVRLGAVEDPSGVNPKQVKGGPKARRIADRVFARGSRPAVGSSRVNKTGEEGQGAGRPPPLHPYLCAAWRRAPIGVIALP
jgi:hypothetical protein